MFYWLKSWNSYACIICNLSFFGIGMPSSVFFYLQAIWGRLVVLHSHSALLKAMFSVIPQSIMPSLTHYIILGSYCSTLHLYPRSCSTQILCMWVVSGQLCTCLQLQMAFPNFLFCWDLWQISSYVLIPYFVLSCNSAHPSHNTHLTHMYCILAFLGCPAV